MNAAMDVIFFLPFLWVISYVRSQTEPKILNISSYQYVSLEIKESVNLSCIIQNNSGYTLSWNRKVNSTVEKISTNDTLNNVKNNKFAVNFDTNSTTPAYILTINGIEKSDFGTYICEISTGQNSISSKETKLELYVHPNFDNSTKNEVKVNEGSNFTIKCYADGNPMPTVTLKRYDTSSTAPIFSHPEHEWNIEKITKKDEGNYTCQADTSFGSVPWNIMILVISKPIFQNCTINLHYEPKFSAEFVCVINSVTNVTIFWFRNGKKLTNSKNVTMTSHRELDQKFHVVKLNISNVEKHGVYSVTVENDRGNATQTFSFSNDTDSLWLKDEGNYTSQANTSFGSDPWNITILVSSKLVFQNCTINLHYEPKFSAEFICVINSVTNVTIFWFRNGKKLVDGDNVTTSYCELDKKFHVVKLNISNVEKHGTYSVTAKNVGDDAAQTFSFWNDTNILRLISVVLFAILVCVLLVICIVVFCKRGRVELRESSGRNGLEMEPMVKKRRRLTF